MRLLSQLEEPQLPLREAFHSWLRKSELSEEDYAVFQRAWTEKGMRTLRDFLVWYNNLDVVPFLEALDKMSQFWRQYGVDMLKEAISLSGLALKFKMSFLKEQGLHLSSFHTGDLSQLFKDNLVGGPAIIFHRHAEKGHIKIRQIQYGQAARPVQRVVGYDAMPCTCKRWLYGTTPEVPKTTRWCRRIIFNNLPLEENITVDNVRSVVTSEVI